MGDGRLRKRQRSPSPTANEQGHPRKRTSLRKAPSPVTKRTSNAKSSREKATPNPARRGRPATDQGLQSTPSEVIQSEDHGAPRQESLAAQQTAKVEGAAEVEEANDIAQTSADMNAVISQIVDHGETVDSQHALRGDTSPAAITAVPFPRSASFQLKTQSLPVLDNLVSLVLQVHQDARSIRQAVQVLAAFANSSYQEILALTSDASSEPGAAYSTLKSLFDHTKKVYSPREPFLSPRELGFNEQDQIDIIRKANLATFVSSVFGSQDVGFYHLDEFFLDTFVVDGGRLLKNQAGLFLDLKTQAYISAISNGERSRDDILHDLFPDDLERRLLIRRSGAKQPSPGEADLIQRASNRKKMLLEEPMTAESMAQLPEKYVWEDFLREISSYISRNFNAIAGPSVSINSSLRGRHPLTLL